MLGPVGFGRFTWLSHILGSVPLAALWQALLSVPAQTEMVQVGAERSKFSFFSAGGSVIYATLGLYGLSTGMAGATKI